jgi:hypothetical protein
MKNIFMLYIYMKYLYLENSLEICIECYKNTTYWAFSPKEVFIETLSELVGYTLVSKKDKTP